jgi:CubicO group peptidase (beta-lactamase class C family)
MTKFKLIIVSLMFLLFLVNPGDARPGAENPPNTVKKLENYLNKLEKVGFSGSVLVELDGKKLISKGFGYRNAAAKLKNTPTTVFDIGSITKQFTAAAILKLEMQGKLGTGDKITKYFENVPADKSDITIHDLLRHQSGLPGNVGGDYEPISESEFVEKVFKSPLRFKNGTAFSYSNIGYSLLAMIVEKASGESYERNLYRNLWETAGMESTGYTRPEFAPDVIAYGYEIDQEWGRPTDKKWDTDAPFWHLKGNGGILSTTEDLYRWHLALLSDKILSKEAKRKYFAPELRPDETVEGFYAYGWDVHQTERKTTVIQHNGSNRIFYADFQRYVDEDVTIIMLLNKAQPGFNRATFVMADIIFGPSFEPTIPIAENRANRLFTEEVLKITLDRGFDAGIKSYGKRDKRIDLIERLINDAGYELISKEDFVKAIAVFKLNVFAFPKSANAYDSLGEAYYLNKNYDLSLINYKKSLDLDPRNDYAREMIVKIEESLESEK